MSEHVPDWAIEATEPSAIEIQRLSARLRDVQPASRGLAPIVAVAAVAALLMFVLVRPSYGPGPQPGETVALSSAALHLGPSILLTGLGEAVVQAAEASGTRLRLLHGTVQAEVDPDGRFRAFTVHAGDVDVSVVGTKFRVSWDAPHGSVSVERGAVSIVRKGSERQLRAGESWSWTGDIAAGEAVLEHPVPGVDDGAPGLPGGDARLTPGAVADGTAGAIASEAPKPPIALPAQPSPAVHADAPEPDAPAPIDHDGPVAAIEPLANKPDSALSEGLEPNLTRARAFGRVQEAMESADYADAAALADRFLASWPGGALGAEAAALQVEALAQTDPSASVSAADVWLANYPAHTRRAEVLRIRATTANDALRDCALALPSYRELSELETGREQAQALAFLGLCAQQTGDNDTAIGAIDAALNHSDLPRPLAPSLRAARRALSSETPR